MRTIFDTGRDFLKLEKIAVGGLKGRQISAALTKILEEFNNKYRDWTNGVTYNVLDPDESVEQFQQDVEKFNDFADKLERRIAFQFELALLDSHDLMLCGSLLLRPIIKEQLDPHMHILVDDLAEEIHAVKKDFNVFEDIYRKSGVKVSNINELGI